MRLFISYAHVNRSRIGELQKLLEKMGNEVWFDNELSGGDNWWQHILDEIERSDVFTFALSPQSTISAACRAEYQYALDLNKPILPILLKDAELPIGKLQETQFVDARKLNSGDTALAISRSLLNLQKQVLSSQYAVPDPRPLRPAFPFEADPLKDVREHLRSLPDIAEDEIVRLIFRLKQAGRLSDKTARESRLLLEKIMTSPHIPHSVAMEASDALKTLPEVSQRPTWIYAAGGIIGMVVILLAILLLSNRGPELSSAETTISSPTLMPRVIPTPANGRTAITTENAGQLERLEWLGRGLPSHIAWSPDGTTVAVSTLSGMVWLYDTQMPDAPLRKLEGHTDKVEGVAFSPSGTLLASASFDGTVRLWDVATGTLVGDPIIFSTSWARRVAFSPDGSLLAVGGCWQLQVFDVTVPETPKKKLSDYVGTCVDAVAFSPDGSQVAYGGALNDDKQELKIVDIASRTARVLGAHEGYIFAAAFTPDGTLLASAGFTDQLIQLWDVTSGEPVGEPFTGHTEGVNSLVFTLDGTQLISASNDNTLRFWDVTRGEPVGEPLTGHTQDVESIALSPDGEQLASISADGTLRFWDVATRQAVGEPQPLFNAWGRVAAFTYDSTSLIASYADGSVHLWDIAAQSGQQLGSHGGYGQTPVTINPANPNMAASGGVDDIIRLYDLTARQEMQTFQRTYGDDINGDVQGLAFSPDGTRIAAAMSGNDDAVRIWALSGGPETVLRASGDGFGNADSMTFSPTDNNLLAAGYGDGTVLIWDVQKGEPRFTLPGHTDSVWALAFSPDGQYLLSGSDDKTIRIWDVEDGSLVKRLSDFDNPVRSLAFNPDGTLLAAGITDSSVVWLWDMTDINEPRVVTTWPLFVFSVAFSPDGTLLAVNSSAGAIAIWGLPQSQ